MDGPLKALSQVREGLERALGFIRSKRKSSVTMEPKLRAQLVEWEQKLEGLLTETVAAAQSGLAATPMVATGLLSRAGQALYGFTQFAQRMLGGIGQRALEGAKEGAQQGAKLAVQGAKGAGNLAEGLKGIANQAVEGAVEGAKQGAKGALKGLKNAAAAVTGPGAGGRTAEGTGTGAGAGTEAGPGTGTAEGTERGAGVGAGTGAGEAPGGTIGTGTGTGTDQGAGAGSTPGPAGANQGPSATGRPGSPEFVMPPQVPLGDPVPIGGHTLPPLPYAYNALEPYIDEETMRLHHDKHHQSYVDGLNKAEKALVEARRKGDYSLVKHWERELAFHGAGHYLHSIFWKTMAPDAGGKPKGELATLIDRDFGSFDLFKQHFSKAAEEVEGGGWAILVWAPRARRLQILQAEKHQNLSQQDVIPLLPLDVWEHSYYLKYQNRRPEYVKNWWNVVNWPMVERRLAAAVLVEWPPA